MHIFPFQRTLEITYRKKKLHTKLKNEGWSFSQNRFDMIDREQLDWQKHYCPVDLIGKTVLDVGAGEGESARFYLQHGAKKVIAIEPEYCAYQKLKHNSLTKRIVSMYKRFEVSDLLYPHDFMKMDIEGYEETVLDHLELLKPSVIEVHGLPLIEKFRAAGFRIVDTSNLGASCTSMAYWKC